MGATTLLQGLALFARRRYRLVFAVTAVLVVVSILLASRLQFDTDVMNLLPRNEPAVEAFREALEDFGSVDYLMVVVRIPEGAAIDPYTAYLDLLAPRLQEIETISEVEYRVAGLEELVESFLPKAMLFLDEAGLERVAAAVSDERLRTRAMEIKRLLSTPQSLAVKDLVKLDPFGLSTILLDQLDRTRGGLSLDWASGYLLSQDRRILLLLAKPVRPPQDVDFSKELVSVVGAEVEAALEEWRQSLAEARVSEPEVELGGRYIIGLGDADLIRRDVIANLVTSMAGVLLLFLIAFRRFGPLMYAFVPLACGLALTFGLSAVVYGSLSSATSGVAALLIGLGIDFVIVSYGRFVEERQSGIGLESALARMNGSSGRAVVVGATTSAATFYAFGVTDFTGLVQMGFLTGTGILLCMLAVLFLLPAMMAWSEDRHQRRRRYPKLVLHGLGSARLIKLSLRFPVAVLLISGAVTAAAAFFATGLGFEDSIQAMRPKGNRGVEIREEVLQSFGSGFEQMMLVVEGETLEEALSLAHRGSLEAAELVASGVLIGADGVSGLIPPPERQRSALAWLNEARDRRLSMERIRRVFAEGLASERLRYEPFSAGVELFAAAVERSEPVGAADFDGTPETQRLLDRYLQETEDGWRSAIYLHPPAGIWRREAPPETTAMAERLGPQVQLTGANVISSVLRTRVLEDAFLAAVVGFVVVGLLLWADYRRLLDTVWSLAPLFMGIVWMLGCMGVAGLPMNFMNIFVTTMIIGIGVDYGVHMIHRYRELQSSDDETLYEGIVETGKAIVLAALSTIVGFGSLSRSHYPGVASMGVVAIFGAVSTCLVAITVLPAYLSMRRRRTRRRNG